MNSSRQWNSDDEGAFHRLVSDAQGLADITEKMVSRIQGDLLFEDASLYPGATILHLERWAAIEFAGGLLMLTRPHVANASIPLLRGILETYSHAYWIRQGSANGADSQAGRALCYELTIARELRDAVSHAPKEVTTVDAIPEAKRRVTNLDKLLTGLGAKCKGRDYTDVFPTIREIAKSEPDLEWLPEMVRATRMSSSHSVGLNFGNILERNRTIEYRYFDSSLDPARLQANIKLACWVTKRAAELPDTAIPRERTPLGSHRSPRDPDDGDRLLRRFADLIFVRPKDKLTLYWVYQRSAWQRTRARAA